MGKFFSPKVPSIQQPAPVVDVADEAVDETEKRKKRRARTQLLETEGGFAGDTLQPGQTRTLFGN